MGALTVADLVPGEAEPRIKDLVLAERLGFGKPKAIREIVARRRAELECCGVLPQITAKPLPGSRGGRPEVCYLLNQAQAALLCMWSRTPTAEAIRIEMVNVFLAYKRGELLPAEGFLHRSGAKSLPTGLTENQVAEARSRLAILGRVDELMALGIRRTRAVIKAAEEAGVSQSSLWAWLKRIHGHDGPDQMQAIAPQWRGGGKTAEIDPEIWFVFRTAQIAPGRRPFAHSYARAQAAADALGVMIPHVKTFQRRFQDEAAAELRKALLLGCEVAA